VLLWPVFWHDQFRTRLLIHDEWHTQPSLLVHPGAVCG